MADESTVELRLDDPAGIPRDVIEHDRVGMVNGDTLEVPSSDVDRYAETIWKRPTKAAATSKGAGK